MKNIILDGGGIIFYDSKENIQKVLNKNCDKIKILYESSYKTVVVNYSKLNTKQFYMLGMFGINVFNKV